MADTQDQGARTVRTRREFLQSSQPPNLDMPVNSIQSGQFGQIIDTVVPATTPYGAFAGVTLSGRIIQLTLGLAANDNCYIYGSEDELYAAMDWLLERQGRIEKKLAARHLGRENRLHGEAASGS